MDKLYYQQKLASSVCSPNDFSVSDEVYFTGNGRTERIRPPLADERPDLVRALQRLGYTPFGLICRDDMTSPARMVALIGLDGEAATALPAELARMGTEQMIALTRRRDVHTIVLEA